MINEAEFPPLPAQTQRAKKSLRKTSHCIEASRLAKEQRSSAASLNDLPDELIVEVLDYLPGINLQHFQLLTLANLSLTNRRLHRIVSERLYTAFDSFFCTPYPFVRTISSDTGLASHVKSVSFRYGPNAHEDRPVYAPSISDKQKIKDGLKRLNMADWKKWASCCNEAGVEQERLYATLLLYTPNVSMLDIDDGALEYKFPDWLKMLRQAVGDRGFRRIHRFEHLGSIRIDLQYLKLRHLSPVFKLHSMRTVTLIGLIEWGNTKQDDPESLRRLLPAGISRVEYLHLKESFVHSDVLDVLISSIQKLRSFEYRSSDSRFVVNGHGSADYWGDSFKTGFERYDEDDAINRYEQIFKSLSGHGRSLERLCLHDDLSVSRFQCHAYDLSSFEKLVDIEIPLMVLVNELGGPKRTLVLDLPLDVQSLTIVLFGMYCYKGRMEPAIVNFLDCASSLNKLTIVHNSSTERIWSYRKLRVLCVERGVVLEVKRIDDDFPESSETSTSDAESLYSD